MADGSKRCRRCGKRKPLEAFNRSKRSADGRHHWCRACFSDYNRARYEAKREQIKAAARAYRAANLGLVKARVKAAYWRDVEASRALGRARAPEQNAKRKAAKEAWARADRAANPEKWREKDRRERKRNPMARKAIQYRRRAVKKQMPRGTVTAVGLAARWDFYGGRCWMCGAEATEFDHVKPLKHGGTHCHANLRPACVPCNRRKQAIWPFPGAGLT